MKRSFRVRTCCIVGICGLLLGLLATPICADAGSDQLRLGGVVLFAFASPSGGKAGESELTAQYAMDLFELISEGLIRRGGSVSVVKFNPLIPSVQRAIREQKCDEKEVSAPIDTTPAGFVRAVKLAALTGAQLAVIGSIDRYAFSKDEAEVTATLQLVDVINEKVVMRFTASGHAAQAGQSEEALGTAATYDLAEKLLSDVTREIGSSLVGLEESAFTTIAQPSSPKRDKSLIPAMIGAMLLGFLISGG